MEETNNKGFIVLENVNKIYPNGVQAVFDFNLNIQKHEFIVLVGPSGCGKSTTLRMITGLEDISSGDLFIDGVYSNDIAPKDRDLALVFQSYALYPHMSVYDNLAFGLKMRKVAKEEIDRKVKEAAKILEIEDLLDRKPAQLSGGQRQRVALGRAIVRNAKLFLMDEPLSNLDAKLRVQMRSEIVKLHKRINATTIYVTHDQTEAMTMADRIVVMKDGYIQQIGSSQEIYHSPKNIFVAKFIGSPAMNVLEGEYFNGELVITPELTYKLSKELDEAVKAFYKDVSLEEAIERKTKLEESLAKNKEKLKKSKKDEMLTRNIVRLEGEIKKANLAIEIVKLIKEGKPFPLALGVRPENIELASKKGTNSYELPITFRELLGDEYHLHLKAGETELIFKTSAKKDSIYQDDEVVRVCFDEDKIHLFDLMTDNVII